MHYGVCDYLMDIAQNGMEAGATLVQIALIHEKKRLSVKIVDNGKGMTREGVAKALDPFYSDGSKHPGRRVGLGLPFLRQAVESVEGEFVIDSEPGRGTSVFFAFPLDHIDSPPVGDLTATFLQILSFPGDHDVHVHRTKVDGSSWEVKRSELIEALGDLETVGSLNLLGDYLVSMEEDHGENDA